MNNRINRKESYFFAAISRTIAIVAILYSGADAQGYEFNSLGGGFASPSSVERTVAAPCHAGISAVVSGIRFDNWDSDFSLTVEFRKPGVSLTLPPSYTRVFMVRTAMRTETFSVPGQDSGCGSAWRIRLVPTVNPRGTRIVGNFSVMVNSTAALSIDDAALLANGRSTTKNIGGSGGLHQGWVEITGTWNQSIFGAPGPLPVKLTFTLLKPNGEIAVFDTGHSNHEFNPCCSGDKLKLRYLIREHSAGQWKLRITNDSGQDAMTIIPKATFKSSCN
jgi:hypothetical protein